MTIAKKVMGILQEVSTFNADVQVAPACILWPDHDRVWEGAVPTLQEQLPELFVFGAWDQEKKTGPAIWLKCVISRLMEGASYPSGSVPIVYLPGVSRGDLRAIDSCKVELKPIAELQYRGTIWSHPNGRDWTPQAFLKVYCGIDVAGDNATKESLPRAISALLEEEVTSLQGKRLDAAFFNKLIVGDPVKNLLAWIDNCEGFRARQCDGSWQAFVETCKSEYAFDPDTQSVLDAASILALHESRWLPVWERYCDAPERYPNIPVHIRKCEMPSKHDLFSGDESFEGWPQWNSYREKELLESLKQLAGKPTETARAGIIALENAHAVRRSLVWARLGEAPMAIVLEHLTRLANTTSSSMAVGGFSDIQDRYARSGWLADDAMLRVLACKCRHDEKAVIEALARTIYLPWCDEAARHLQQLSEKDGYPFTSNSKYASDPVAQGECTLFVDGLRFDVGRRLAGLLEIQGLLVSEAPVWSALPSVTATAKPAVSPVREHFKGADSSADFEPSLRTGSRSQKGSQALGKLLADKGWLVLDKTTNGTGEGHAWCETGDIDKQGHDNGIKLASLLDDSLAGVVERVEQLLGAGWKTIRIVTDHGWLLMPGGLPKIELPADLTASKWGRCASLKEGAHSREHLYPWFWNSTVHFALADGASCYHANSEYAHGGLSIQECLTDQLTVTAAVSVGSLFAVKITDVSWVNQRCNVSIEGMADGVVVDLRMRSGDPESSLLDGEAKQVENGKASFVIEDDSNNGKSAAVVLLDGKGNVVAQAKTQVAGG